MSDPIFRLQEFRSEPDAVALLDRSTCEALACVPLVRSEGRLLLAMARPDPAVQDALSRAVGAEVLPVRAPEAAIRRRIAEVYRSFRS